MYRFKIDTTKIIRLVSFIALLCTACLKDDPLKPNKVARPLTQQPVFLDTAGRGLTGGGTTGVGTTDSEFFNFTLNGQNVSNKNPSISGSTTFGQIISKLAASDFFQLTLILAGRTFPNTTVLGPFSNSIVYNETTLERYNREAGLLIFSSNSQDKITGTFDVIMKNTANPNDSIIVKNESFSVSK